MSWQRVSDSLGWSQGHIGKGYLLHDGTIKTWSVDPFHPVDHADVHAQNHELSPSALNFEIDPDGGVVTDQPTVKVESIIQADPRLYDAGQRPVFEDSWDLGQYEPKEEQGGKPDLNFVMSAAEARHGAMWEWPWPGVEGMRSDHACPRCHQPQLNELGYCTHCGYHIPYDGGEVEDMADFDPRAPGMLDPEDTEGVGAWSQMMGPHYGAWHLADGPYGYTNDDTATTILMIDNDAALHEASRKLVERGGTSAQLRDWAMRKVIGPHNREQIKDAQEWNAIPLEERQRRKRQHDIDQWGEEVVNMGEGLMQPWHDWNNEGKSEEEIRREQEYEAPDLIDPELVNWDELRQGILDEFEENAAYERHDAERGQRMQDQGLDFRGEWDDENEDRMLNALYKYHGAKPESWFKQQGLKYWDDPRWPNNINIQQPFAQFKATPGVNWPDSYIEPSTRVKVWGLQRQRHTDQIYQELRADPKLKDLDDEVLHTWAEGKYQNLPLAQRDVRNYSVDDDPEMRALVESDPRASEIMTNGYSQALPEFTRQLIYAIQHGQQHPATPMLQEAMTQQGYTPEQMSQFMQPKWRWDPETQEWIELGRPPTQEWTDDQQRRQQQQQYLDSPGDTYLPQEWTSHVANSTDSWHRNTWTGLLCNCPWHGSHRKLQRLAGEHINKLLKAPDKAYKTPEGQQLIKTLTEELPEQYESLYPYLAHRFKKGDLRNRNTGLLEWTAQTDPMTREVPENAYFHAMNMHDLGQWHQWYEARQHPTRRGVDVFDPGFTMQSLVNAAYQHQNDLRQQRELKEALGHGETEMKFPNGWSIKHLTSRENDYGDYNNVYDALGAEGHMMGHCIGSDEQPYQDAAAQGMISVYSLRDPKGRPHATWHYNSDGSLAEMFGPNDDPIKPEYQEMIDAWGARSGNNTDPSDAQGNQEGGHDASFTFPAARDMEDYVTFHDPESYYDYASENGDIGEHTELDWSPTDWEEIASEYLHGSYVPNGFFETLQATGETGFMASALKEQCDPTDADERDAINNWNASTTNARYEIDLPNLSVSEVDKYNEATNEGEDPEVSDWYAMAQDYLNYPHVYRADQYGGQSEYGTFHQNLADYEPHQSPMAEWLAQAVNWDNPKHVEAAEHWNRAFPEMALQRPPPPAPTPQPQDPNQLQFIPPGVFEPDNPVTSAQHILAPAVELREWLADLSGDDPEAPSIHHDSPEDTVQSPAVSPADDLPFFPPANVPKEYKTAASPITQADATNDPLGKNPAIVPSRQGDPDYLQEVACQHCQQAHRPDQPCPDSSVGQYKAEERAWYGRDPNAIHGAPEGLGQHQMDLAKTAVYDFDDETEGDMASPNMQRWIGWVPSEAINPEFNRREVSKGDPAKVDAIKQDLLKRGFLNPVWVDYHPDTKMIYGSEGNHRLTAARELGIPVPVTVMRSMREPHDPSVLTGPYEYIGNEADVISGDPPQYMHPRDIGLPEAAPWSPQRKAKTATGPVYYHAAPGSYHNQIATEGLRGHEPEIQSRYSPWEWLDDPAPERHPVSNYLWSSAERAWQYAHDERFMDPVVYAVDASGLPVESDPDDMWASEGATHVPAHITPDRLSPVERPEGPEWDWSHLAKTAAWDPLVCEHCGGAMTEPRQLGSRWVNNCTRCKLTRDVPANYPLLQEQRKQEELTPYPELLKQVAPERAWVTAAYDHEDSLIETATALVDGGSDVSEAASWLGQALVQSGRSPQDAELIADEVFMRREGKVSSDEISEEAWDEHRTAAVNPFVSMKETIDKLASEIAQMQKPSGVQPLSKKPRKLVINRDDAGRMTSIEEV